MVKKHHYITKALFSLAVLVILGLSVVRAGPVSITTSIAFGTGTCGSCSTTGSGGAGLQTLGSGGSTIFASNPAMSTVDDTGINGAITGLAAITFTPPSGDDFTDAGITLTVDSVGGFAPVLSAAIAGSFSGALSNTTGSSVAISWGGPISFTTMNGNTYNLTLDPTTLMVTNLGGALAVGGAAITGTLELLATPEPTTMLLFGSGLALAGYLKRRRKLGGDSSGLA
jgi:hypothetical protein